MTLKSIVPMEEPGPKKTACGIIPLTWRSRNGTTAVTERSGVSRGLGWSEWVDRKDA